MKKLVIALLLAMPLGLFAQNLKIGYINKQEIITVMPEYATAMKQLEDTNLKYITEGKKLEEELQRKFQEYQAQADTLDAAIRQYKENELNQYQRNIQAFVQSAEETLKKKQQELMMPIINKINQAIKKVGDENGFTYIIDNAANIIPYVAPRAENVLPLIKKALNIQ